MNRPTSITSPAGISNYQKVNDIETCAANLNEQYNKHIVTETKSIGSTENENSQHPSSLKRRIINEHKQDNNIKPKTFELHSLATQYEEELLYSTTSINITKEQKDRNLEGKKLLQIIQDLASEKCKVQEKIQKLTAEQVEANKKIQQYAKEKLMAQKKIRDLTVEQLEEKEKIRDIALEKLEEQQKLDELVALQLDTHVQIQDLQRKDALHLNEQCAEFRHDIETQNAAIGVERKKVKRFFVSWRDEFY